MENTKQHYAIHHKAIQYIIADEIIQKKDVRFAESLYYQEFWTLKQAHAIDKLLNTYKQDLIKMEITLPDIKNAPSVDPEWCARLRNNEIFLLFYTGDKNKFFNTVDTIKNISGRKYHGQIKQWSIPKSKTNIKNVMEMGFILDAELKKWYQEQTDPNEIAKKQKKVDPVVLSKKVDLNDIMYPYQKEGLSFLEQMNGRGLLGDDMGLGKTVQALAYLKLHPEIRPALIIVPASLKINWQRESVKWIGEKPVILNGKQGNTETIQNKEKIYVINYDIISNKYETIKDKNGNTKKKELPETGWIDFLTKANLKCIIMDECHKIMNSKAQRTKAIKKLCTNVKHIIGLSGTPILNRPIELFTILNILKPDIFPSYYRYGQRYCDASHNGFGMTYKGVTRAEELHDLLKEHIMLRRKKSEVLTELPDKQKSIVLFELDPENRKKYNQAENDVIQYIHSLKGRVAADKAMRAEALARFNQLKQITADGKIKAIVEWVSDFLESDEKLVLFAIHKKVVTEIMKKFEKIAVKIDGSVSSKNRQKAVDEFQNNPDIKLFVGNMPSASEGITLTTASNLTVIELPWTPGILEQSEDRIHRIGQGNACNIYYLLAQNTIEEDIAKALDGKTKNIAAILDGEIIEDDDKGLLTDMIEKYENKNIIE